MENFAYNYKILSYEQAEKKARELKFLGKSIVMVSGCYDLVHVAHVIYLKKCKNLGDVLFLSLGSDETIRKLKGPNRPIIKQEYRAGLLAAMECVDYVVIAEESLNELNKIDYEKLFKTIKPNILAVNNNDSSLKEKQEFAENNGAKLGVIDCTDHPKISTSEIEKGIKES